MTKAFDLACFMPVNPTVVGDAIVVTAANPMRTDWAAMQTGGAFVPPATVQGQTLVAGAGPGFAYTAQMPAVQEAPLDGHTYARVNAGWTWVWSKAEADSRYQASDPDLNAIAGLSGTGLLQCAGGGAWSLTPDLDAGTF